MLRGCSHSGTGSPRSGNHLIRYQLCTKTINRMAARYLTVIRATIRVVGTGALLIGDRQAVLLAATPEAMGHRSCCCAVDNKVWNTT